MCTKPLYSRWKQGETMKEEIEKHCPGHVDMVLGKPKLI